mmetsp:Transcript_7789/g.12922  ORF Transcript_7789/g.12922 Transcript_7789/m.12922 type:complete len:163 (+) Transcript_7789:43-531(+)
MSYTRGSVRSIKYLNRASCLATRSRAWQCGSGTGMIKSSIITPYQVFGAQRRHFVKIVFVEESTGDRIEAEAEEGKTVLDAAIDHNVDIEGACGGELACSTCHVVLSQELFDSLPEKSEEEEDMLDLAWGLTETSRLCCQLKVTPELEGSEFNVPADTNNML